jgi:hypothetical protein
MPDLHNATRYIAVAGPSNDANQAWTNWYQQVNGVFTPRPPVHQDYALMKVLYMLGLKADNNAGIPTGIRGRTFVHLMTGAAADPPLDFSGLRDSDVIFIAGHGNSSGLYEMGPDANKGMKRLLDVLTKDGNLQKKRANKKTIILLLSCRAGLGFHKSLAHELWKSIGIDVTVGGALGFTFGSMRTFSMAQNEVLIQGIPWHMEYEGSIKLADAEKMTSAREGKEITIAGKQNEISAFMTKKGALENEMKTLIGKLQSTEVNKALDELVNQFPTKWMALIREQFEFYSRAKVESNLEFDMWYNLLKHAEDAYVWTNENLTTDQEVDTLLANNIDPRDTGPTSTR